MTAPTSAEVAALLTPTRCSSCGDQIASCVLCRGCELDAAERGTGQGGAR
jgi:hypothetical protein